MTEWQVRRLGELCNLRRDHVPPDRPKNEQYVAMEHLDSGRTSLQRWVVADGVRSNKGRFRKGDILYGKLRPYLDKAVVAPFDGVCSTELLVLDPDADRVDPKFLCYLIHTAEFRAFAEATTAGVNHPRTSWSSLAAFEALIPPTAEQAAIASVLDVVEAAIRTEELLFRSIDRLKSATMAKLFREGLRGEPLKQTEIGEIPESWEVTQCDDLCDSITVGIVVTPAKYYVPTGVACFRSFNIKPNRLQDNDLVFISPESNELHSKSKLRAGDVLVVRTGYPGTACVVPPQYDGANCIDLLIARPKAELIDGRFLAAYLNSPEGKSQVAQQQGGLAQQHYNVGALRRLRVPIPSPDEQIAIANVVETIERRLAVSEQKRAKLQVLFSTLLHELMTGSIRVKDLDLAEVSHA
jgi:type I restriction enzyme S subunit